MNRGDGLDVEQDSRAAFRGMYRVITLRKAAFRVVGRCRRRGHHAEATFFCAEGSAGDPLRDSAWTERRSDSRSSTGFSGSHLTFHSHREERGIVVQCAPSNEPATDPVRIGIAVTPCYGWWDRSQLSATAVDDLAAVGVVWLGWGRQRWWRLGCASGNSPGAKHPRRGAVLSHDHRRGDSCDQRSREAAWSGNTTSPPCRSSVPLRVASAGLRPPSRVNPVTRHGNR